MPKDHDVTAAPLSGIRILDCSILGPGALAMHLGDLGAEIIKVEAPAGDPLRSTTWPMVDGTSLMHLHINRSKRSIAIDLRTPAGARLFEDLARTADAVIEGMRPGALDRLGLGYDHLRTINARLVFCSISGFGSTGPYQRLPTHGLAFDAWAGLVAPVTDEAGRWSIPEHPSVGIHAAPIFGALGVTAALLASRTTGEGTYLEIAQSDAAAAMDWLRSETWLTYRREAQGAPTEAGGPEAEASPPPERRAPGTAGMHDSVRYQFYGTSDHRHVLLMASEQRFWRNFCVGIDRIDLYERWPGVERGDHASGNTELRDELQLVFSQRSMREWVDFAVVHDTAIAPVNTPELLIDDPQFHDRFPLHPADALGCEQLPTPLHFDGGNGPAPVKAPTLGQHTVEVLRSVLDLDDDQIERLRAEGAIYGG